MRTIIRLIALGLTLSATTLAAQADDQAAVLAAVKGFHDALARGDSTSALAFLAQDVQILETGGRETRDEYRSGHLRGDIAFAQAVPTTRGEASVTISGNVAWVVSTSRTQGTYRDRPINSAGAELMVLTRETDGWRIRAIHWSSRTIRSTP